MSQATSRSVARRAALALVAGVGLVACGSTPPPHAEIQAAEEAIGEAEEIEAAEHAPGPLGLARDKLSRARTAMQAEDHVQARRLAEQALVDARLAETEARSAIARRNAAELRESIEVLRGEIDRQRDRSS